MILVDSENMSRRWLMVPFLHPRNDAEERYNRSHKKNRVTIGMDIGLKFKQIKFIIRHLYLGRLKLHSGLRLDLNSISEATTTAVVFHNIATELRIEGADLDGPLYEEDDENDENENVFIIII